MVRRTVNPNPALRTDTWVPEPGWASSSPPCMMTSPVLADSAVEHSVENQQSRCAGPASLTARSAGPASRSGLSGLTAKPRPAS